MTMLRCTVKLQKAMGLTKADLAEATSTAPESGDWYANLIVIDRRPCLLFTHASTLFNFIVPDVPRHALRDVARLFQQHLTCVLADEGLEASAQERLLHASGEIRYGPTQSRRVLGSMNDLAFHYTAWIHDLGGVHSAAIPSIIRKLNRMPMSALTYRYPIDALKAFCRQST